ncbi:MAG: YwiC-like family protein [Candidatus Nanopelagicales bacterium]
MVWVGLAYLLAFAVNVAYACRRDQRALSNDVVFVAECGDGR